MHPGECVRPDPGSPCFPPPDRWLVRQTGGSVALIDGFGLPSDATIRRYVELGCEVRCLGRGHVQRIKEAVRAQRPQQPGV